MSETPHECAYDTPGAGMCPTCVAACTPAEPDAGDVEAWPLGDQHGYDIKLCTCEDGAYLGARQMGQPCRCERCGFMTAEQWEHIANAVRRKAGDELARAVAEVLPDECWITRSTSDLRCTAMIGGGFENGAKWSEDMCCLPCRVRARIARESRA